YPHFCRVYVLHSCHSPLRPPSLSPARQFVLFIFFPMIRPPPISTLFPYTTLFRSFLVLWLKLVKDFLKVRCRLALLQRTFKKSLDRKSGSAGMPRPISYAVFCLKKKKNTIR